MSSAKRNKKNKRRDQRQKEKKESRQNRYVANPSRREADHGLADGFLQILVRSSYFDSLPPGKLLRDFNAVLPHASEAMRHVWERLSDATSYMVTGEPFLASDRDRADLEAMRKTFLNTSPSGTFELFQLLFRMGRESLSDLEQYCGPDLLRFDAIRNLFSTLNFLRSGQKLTSKEWHFCRSVLLSDLPNPTPVQQFLNLKHPKPSAKTAQNLDLMLQGMDLDSRNARVLRGLIRVKLGLENQDPASSWQATPHLFKMIMHTPSKESHGRSTKIQPARFLTLPPNLQNQILRSDVTALSYEQALRMHAVQLRCLHAQIMEIGPHEFREKLLTLLRFLHRGVPPDSRNLATPSLSLLCKWLVECLAADRQFDLGLRASKSLAELMPDDYRAQAFHWFSVARTGKSVRTALPANGWQHVNFTCFYQGLFVAQGLKTEFCVTFFDPLSAESRKELVIKSCERAFARDLTVPQIQHMWEVIGKHLLPPECDLVRHVAAGRPCEPEFLLPVAYSLAESGRARELSESHLYTLLRFGERSLHVRSTYVLMRLYSQMIPTLGRQAPADALMHLNKLAQAHAESAQLSPAFALESRFLSQCKELITQRGDQTGRIETDGFFNLANLSKDSREKQLLRSFFKRAKADHKEGAASW